MKDARAACGAISGISSTLLLVSALTSLWACEPSCAPDEITEPVHGGKGGYVCIPSDHDSTSDSGNSRSASATSTSADDAGLSFSLGSGVAPTYEGGSAPTGTCATLPSTGLDVSRVMLATEAPPLTPGVAPDATYVLSQMLVYPAQGSAPLQLVTLRATLQVAGSLLVMGTQGASPSLEENESFTSTLSGGQMTLVCKNRTGAVAATLFPDTPGQTEAAMTSYVPSAGVLTLRLVRPFGTVDMFFAKS